MAPPRAFSFPISHAEEASRIRPLPVNKKDVADLRTNAAFQVIRSALRNQQDAEFCHEHCADSRDTTEAWCLQRDITHALILPILEVYRFALRLARRLRGTRNIFDLELVFRGEARGAFSWLQCFIAEEEDWCMTRGCPGCIVSHVLEAEPTIRMVLVACRLSEATRQQTKASSLPMFKFWLGSLKRALDEDAFWGPGLWRDFEARAKSLERGIEELVKQCIALEQVPTSLEQADESPPLSPCLPPPKSAPEKNLTHEIILGCWTTLLADAAEAQRAALAPEPIQQPPMSRSMTA